MWTLAVNIVISGRGALIKKVMVKENLLVFSLVPLGIFLLKGNKSMYCFFSLNEKSNKVNDKDHSS